MSRMVTFGILASLLVLPACSSSTSPSGSGAVINGTITPSSLLSNRAMTAGAAAGFGPSSAMTVSLVGSSVSASIDDNGHFTLKHVPGGDAVLHFTGSGADATVTVTGVADGETITIVVTVNGAAADLVSDDRSGDSGGLTQLEGRIDSMPPVTAAGTFLVNGTLVETDGSTTFTGNGAAATFADLAVGIRVHVAGTPDGTKLRASRVDVQNTDATIPVVVNGIVSGFSGTATAFQFTVDGTLVKGNASSSFSGNSAFADLTNGVRVEVKGAQQNGFVLATSVHVNAG